MEKSLNTQFPVTYCNITATFSGIGNILVDINGIILSAVKRYSLDIKTCPTQIIYLHYEYILQNLRKYQLKDILCFYEYTGDPYFDLVISVLNDGSFLPFSEVHDSLSNKRIALALSCYERTKPITFLSTSGLYIGMLDYLVFEVPYVFTIMTKPIENVILDMRYECEFEYTNQDFAIDKNKLSVDKLKINRHFNDFDQIWTYNEIVNENVVKEILGYNLQIEDKQERICFDAGLPKPELLIYVEKDRSIFDIKIEKQWSGQDLELIMSPILTPPSIKHLANIRRSAMSLFDGKFHFSSIVKEVVTEGRKVSAKMKKIIEENEARMKAEQEAVDRKWLKSFFEIYSNLPNLKAKKSHLEKLKVNGILINRKLLLLKIELYMEIWNVEKRKDAVDEKVLVPFYLASLKYIEDYVTSEDYNTGELEFVMTKMIEANFIATVREILEKLNIQLNLPFPEDSSSLPNDIDIYFQLRYAGDHLKRTLGTKKDKRVPFDPDKWQVQLLDAVDNNKSAVVSAPTSSGKTFICFYAIEKILKSSDTDVVVFCLPTKALVNQVSADIFARFNPKNVQTRLQGTLMPDTSNDPFNCQVLITLPSMLESLLNSKDCAKIKYIIIDEVHKINDSQLGLKIERIIHLAKCPLLLLSATLGNLENFYNWVKSVEASKNRECELVYHSERYCELKSFVYTEHEETVSIRDEKKADTVSVLPEENIKKEDLIETRQVIKPALVPLNNLFAYSFSHLSEFGFSNDLHFLPEELLNIYYYIYMILEKPQKKLIKDLAPKRFFKSNIISKADVKQYQHYLLKTFEVWVKEGILKEAQVKQIHGLLTDEAHAAFNFQTSEKYIVENILKLLNTLKDESMLPVIVFNTDRDFVTRLAKLVYRELESLDIAKKKDKAMEKMKKELKRTRDVEKTKDSWIEDSIASEQHIEPESRDIRYTFLDPITKLTDYEVREEFCDIKPKDVEKEVMDMAYRGIGIHHSAMNRKYRSAVEILFRKKHVRVLFATETLALGINMPCRTVVFAGDSLELDPMNYKQMSGRAGRRGYDTLGNIVFFGIPKPRVQNLMVSMLPEIQGAYTFTNTSFVSFNIKNSLVKLPLLSANIKEKSIEETLPVDLNNEEIEKKLENLKISNCGVKLTLDVFDSEQKREELVQYQQSIYPFIYPSNYTWDLLISNRDFDPSVFLFVILLEHNKIAWTANEFMLLVASIFEVRTAHANFPCLLPPLPIEIQNTIDKINELYTDDISRFYPRSLQKLQRYSSNPLFHVKSFLYTHQSCKNSYIYDFFQHGSSIRIRRKNMISEGELWASLYNIEVFFKSLIRLLDTYYGAQDERLKKLKLIYEVYNAKFHGIDA